MSTMLDRVLHPRLSPSYLAVGAVSAGAILFLASRINTNHASNENIIPSPSQTVLPKLSPSEIQDLPYPPQSLPGQRDVDSPLGTTRVYEWGPEDGRKILLVHGISTPSIALAGLADKLVQKEFRVMLFDLFGRGYSSGPSPTTHRYDSALYTSQIFLCLQSSPLPWTKFSLIGYSLGGAIAADFTSYFPDLVEGLVLIAPGGLIRTHHITWKSRLLYSTSGLLPEWLIERIVARRLWTGPETARSIEPEPDTDAVTTARPDGPQGELKSRGVYATSRHGLLAGRPGSTASQVVDWQIAHHRGFVPAFISSIRHGPIHEQQGRWGVIRGNVEAGKGMIGAVHVVLGETDRIIVADELLEDAGRALGPEKLRATVVKGVGHEVAISNPDEVVEAVLQIHR